MVDKKVKLTLAGLDGNAFFLMSAFKSQARKEGWTKEEIDEVIKECTSSDYDHLLQTLLAHCEEIYQDDELEFYEDENEFYEEDEEEGR